MSVMRMPRNVGRVDRAIRLTLGALLAIVGLVVLGGLRAEPAGAVVATLGLIGLLTGETGRCPTYQLIGFDTLDSAERATDDETREEAAA